MSDDTRQARIAAISAVIDRWFGGVGDDYTQVANEIIAADAIGRERVDISPHQLEAEIEQAAMRREDARVNYYLRQTSERLDLLRDTRREHMKLVALLTAAPVERGHDETGGAE